MSIQIEIGTIVLHDVPRELTTGLRELVVQRLADRARGGRPARAPHGAPLTGPDELADAIAEQVWALAGLDRHARHPDGADGRAIAGGGAATPTAGPSGPGGAP
jgi:hypothetical protein